MLYNGISTLMLITADLWLIAWCCTVTGMRLLRLFVVENVLLIQLAEF